MARMVVWGRHVASCGVRSGRIVAFRREKSENNASKFAKMGLTNRKICAIICIRAVKTPLLVIFIFI